MFCFAFVCLALLDFDFKPPPPRRRRRPAALLAMRLPVVVSTFGEAYPELVANEAKIVSVIEEEERAFSSMLGRGVKYLEAVVEEKLKQAGSKAGSKLVSGEEAFFLYDSLGFPVDLTEIMAEEKGFSVDKQGFLEAMEAQRERSRAAAQSAKFALGDGAPLVLGAEQTAWLASEAGVPPTQDEAKYKWDEEGFEAEVLAVFTSQGNRINASALALSVHKR